MVDKHSEATPGDLKLLEFTAVQEAEYVDELVVSLELGLKLFGLGKCKLLRKIELFLMLTPLNTNHNDDKFLETGEHNSS